MHPTNLIMIITSGLVCYCGFSEFRAKKIRNEVVGLIAGFFFIYGAVNQQWIQILVNFIFAIILFIPMLHFYNNRLMAGGDLKLATAAFLWVGPNYVVPFLLLTALFIAVRLLVLRTVSETSGERGALAPSIAFGLVATFMIEYITASSGSMVLSWFYRLIYLVFPWAPHTG